MAEPPVADRPVPLLTGRLPPPCRHDLDALRRAVHAVLSEQTPAPPVSAGGFREVLLTGATGFVGRFLLRELLRQDQRLIVHCLIRADSAAPAWNRLHEALDHAEIRDEGDAPRLRVIAGDVCADRFGLDEAEYGDLCRRLHAVYHLAGATGLVLPYHKIRETNVLGIRPVLDLCLRMRFKHLFYFSTLGVFPEYFCNFSREYERCRVDDQAQPDLDEMKRRFPLAAIGYPWTKLVAEQGVLLAKAAGAPVGIFRLPQMGCSSTGYTQADSFPARLFAAATQLAMAPRGFSLQRHAEPVDTVGAICASVSLNPERRFTIYHCCDPTPPRDGPEAADFGLYWQPVPYRIFRRECQALGDRSPLHGQWVLIDHFAPYWFDEDRPGRALPVADGAIREDCPHPIAWPALLIRHARSHDWIRRNRAGWPHPVPQGRLDAEELIGQARLHAERMEVPLERACPPWMREGLTQLVEALKRPEAGLRDDRLSYIVYGLTRSLRNNAALAREARRHPEIERQRIVRPVFIVGINRTGTTFLHRLLARDPRFWTVRRYELNDPVLASGDYAGLAGTPEDPRRAYAEELMHATNLVDTLAGIHRIDVGEPEEDFMLLRHAFATWVLLVAYRVPAYGRWLAETGSGNAYRHHRRVLQHFTWQRRQREPQAGRQWLLKMPFHLMELEVLLRTYPDALFIQTHREPVQFMASWNSLVERVRGLAAPPPPPQETGAEQLALMSGMLNGAMRFRQSHPELTSRWVDLRYADLVDDPMGVVRDIQARFGWRPDPVAERQMRAWLERQAAERRDEPRHDYRLDHYGLTPEAVNAAFAPYLDFAAARGCLASR